MAAADGDGLFQSCKDVQAQPTQAQGRTHARPGPHDLHARRICEALAHGTPGDQQTRETPASQLQRRMGGGSGKIYDFYLDSVPLKNQSRTLPHWPARNLKGKQ